VTLRRPLALGVIALALACPAAAKAHALLEDTSPARGAQLERAPERVSFRFSEPVEAAFGSVRVYDGDGERVDRGSAEHAGGRGDAIAVDLRDGLGDGTYTATYRVISADSHPVRGGFVFTVGRGGPGARRRWASASFAPCRTSRWRSRPEPWCSCWRFGGRRSLPPRARMTGNGRAKPSCDAPG